MKNKFFAHLRTVLLHKWEVFKLMRACGKGWQGFWHDMSKFSPVEFFESVKYYDGTQSPINLAREDKGYSAAWLHHKGRNKHHSQYWIDYSFGNITCAEIPWKYLLEFICDGVAAGKVYCKNAGKEWTEDNPLDYWIRVDSKSVINNNTKVKIEFYYSFIKYYGLKDFCYWVKNAGDFYGQIMAT